MCKFADRASGHIYLRIESGTPVLIDRRGAEAAIADPDTLAGVRAVAPRALGGEARPAMRRAIPSRADGPGGPTLGQWGDAGRR
jgi:hypothetical protein